MEDKKKKILIDGRFIGVGDSMSRYALEILKHILTIDSLNDYSVLIRPQGRKIVEQFLKIANKIQHLSNLKIEVLDIPHYSFSEQTTLLKWLNRKKYDLLHFIQFNHPIRYRGKFVVTIHDLTLLGHLYRMNPLKRLGFKMVMASAVRNSSKIITISNTSKDDIINIYHCDPKKIEVVYNGVDEKFSLKTKQPDKIEQFKKKYGISGKYILYTGMWKRHKNLLRMLKAFEQVKLQDTSYKIQTNRPSVSLETGKSQIANLQLVLVGKIDKNEPEIISEINRINSAIFNSQIPISNQISNAKNPTPDKLTPNAYFPIITTGFVEDDELPLAYAGALVYCIPSLSEGFGLPPLEAMACGTPVISSNISAMPEILGNAPLYFDPYDVKDISRAMKKIIGDEKLQDELSKKGLEQAKKYNWRKTTEETLDVYKNVL